MKVGVHLSPRRVTLTLVQPDGHPVVVSRQLESPASWPSLIPMYEALLDCLAAEFPVSQIEAVTFDIGEVLELSHSSVVHVLRIAPRPPCAPSHEPHIDYGDLHVRIVDVQGGCGAQGQSLAPLDEASIEGAAQDIERGDDVVVCSMGSLVNADHEVRAGELLYAHAMPRHVAHSNGFFSDDITAREYTAVVNTALQPSAESLAVELTRVTSLRMPLSRLYATTNEGGCVPLARLSATPIHMKFSQTAAMFLGAAQLLRVTDGRFAMMQGEAREIVERVNGFFSVVPYKLGEAGVRIATTCVHSTHDTEQDHDLPIPTITVGGGDDDVRLDELASLGAAVAPLSDISTRTINLATGLTERQAIADLEAKVRARLVAFGAQPGNIRVVESRSITSTYSTPDVMSVRVRALEAPDLERVR